MPSTIKQTAFRFTEQDLAFLDAIAEHVGTRSRTEALRVMIRTYVRSEGIKVGPPATTATKTKTTKKKAAKR